MPEADISNSKLFANALANTKAASGKSQKSEILIRSLWTPQKKSQYYPVYLTIKNNTAYISSRVFDTKYKVSIPAGPITSVLLEPNQLLSYIQIALQRKPIKLEHPEAFAIYKKSKHGRHPLFKATGSTSWRNLNATSATYTIRADDEDQHWLLSLHHSPKTRMKFDVYPISTPLIDLVKIILADVQKYPDFLRETT